MLDQESSALQPLERGSPVAYGRRIWKKRHVREFNFLLTGAGLSKTTLLKIWPKLEALELNDTTRTVSKAKMYKLNKLIFSQNKYRRTIS